MRKISLGAVILALLSTAALPAYAGILDPSVTANTNTNANTNVNTNANTNLNNNIQGQGQLQGQKQGQAQGQEQTSRNVNRNTANGGAGGAGGIGGGGGAGGNAGGGNSSQGQELNNSGAGSNSNNYQQSGIPASTATAPSFAIGQCQWAISGGAQFFGFGASGGTAGLYEFCKGMMKAEHFRKIGREDMAKLMECNYGDFREAYQMAGTPCRQDVPKNQQASTPIVQPVGWVAPTQAAVIPTPAAQSVNVASAASQPASAYTVPANCKLNQPGNYLTCN